MDWLDLLVVQRTLKSLLQHHRSKTSILQYSTFFMVQFSRLYMTHSLWPHGALTKRTFVAKVRSLLFNILCRFFIDFLPRRKHLLISWLQLLFTVILECKKIKSAVLSSYWFPFNCLKRWDHIPWSNFLMFSLKPNFSLFSFTSINRLFSSSSLLSLEWYHLHI